MTSRYVGAGENIKFLAVLLIGLIKQNVHSFKTEGIRINRPGKQQLLKNWQNKVSV
jgi:hypothetical protein